MEEHSKRLYLILMPYILMHYPTKLEELLLFRNPTISEALVGLADISDARSKTLPCILPQ